MKKKLLIIIPIVLVLVLGTVGTILYFNNYKIDYKKQMTIKIGEKVPDVKEYVQEKDKRKESQIIWKKLKDEEGKIYHAGSYDGTLTYKKNKYKLKLIVVDDEKPTIEGSKDLSIRAEDEIDLLKDIKTDDNSHDEIKIEIVGEYDTTKVGEYKLTYVATDKSNNKTEVPFTLTVKEKIIQYVSGSEIIGTTAKGYTIERKNGIYYVGGILIANKTYNLPDSYAPGLLDSLNNAFYSLQAGAASEGHDIYIISGYRSYWDQNYIYNNYVARDGQWLADTYSARPGHSEHQSGLAIDVNSLETYFGDQPEGIWLKNNCYKYGFIIRYPYGKDDITGYQYEPWHLRYVGTDLATQLYNGGDWITLEEYLGITSKYS